MRRDRTPERFDNKWEASAALRAPARRLQVEVLTAFTTGQPPSRTQLEDLARSWGLDPVATVAELADRDVVAFDEYGEVRAAYPFSPAPTAHQVSWDGGPAVFAMCAIDALGISAMIGRPVTIASTEPNTGLPITVVVDNDTAVWTPTTTVVYAGHTIENCSASADRTCNYINFFTHPDAAHDWAGRHPEVGGTIRDQTESLQHAITEFGALLQPIATE
jgi:hypothetical protein